MDVSITQRCRKRLEWAKQDDLIKGSEHWVCTNNACKRTICQVYQAYISSKEQLDAARQELREAQANLTNQRNQLRETGSKLAQQSQQGSDELIMKLLEGKVQDKQVIAQDKQVIVQDKRGIVQYKCEVTLKSHELIKETMIHGKSPGNKTDHKTKYTNASLIAKEVEEMDRSEMKNEKKTLSPSKLRAALNDRITEEDNDPKTLNLDEKQRKEVEEFYAFCDNGFSKSRVVPSAIEYKSSNFSEHIRKTCQSIAGWKSGDTATDFYRPSAVGQETQAVHPILVAIMWRLNAILAGTIHFTKEQYLPPQEEKSKRFVDAMVWEAPQQFLRHPDGSLMGESIEIKPISRDGVKFKKIIEEGGNQTLGHILQVLWDACLQFCGGLGRDGSAGGAVLTMISSKFFKAELREVGTKAVDLKICIGKNQPLFSKATTRKLATEATKDLHDLDLEFEENDQNGSMMQPGFVALVMFLKSCSQRQAALDVKGNIKPLEDVKTGDEIRIESYLGSGAFCSVYSAQMVTNTSVNASIVLKIGKSWQMSNEVLSNEKKALSALDHVSIPKLWKDEIVDLKVKQHCEWSMVKALMLKMKQGKSLRQIHKEMPERLPQRVERVLQSIRAALEHAHNRSWYHLDVQPSNIIEIEGENLQSHYILIDWGTAAYDDGGKYKLKSYRGTPPFSHPDLLQKRCSHKDVEGKWQPVLPIREFDNFSLAMTICYVLGNGVSWDGFNSEVVTATEIEARNEKATSLVKDLPTSTKDWLLASLSSSTNSGGAHASGENRLMTDNHPPKRSIFGLPEDRATKKGRTSE